MRSQRVTRQYHKVKQGQSRTRITFPTPTAPCTLMPHWLSQLLSESIIGMQMWFPCSASLNLGNFTNEKNKHTLTSCSTFSGASHAHLGKQPWHDTTFHNWDPCGPAITGPQATSSFLSSRGMLCSAQLECRNVNITINGTISIFQDNGHIIGWKVACTLNRGPLNPLNGCISPFYVGLMNKDAH